jgi:hypothetical protein
MKQAVRENRRGQVRVADELIVDCAPEVALLSNRSRLAGNLLRRRRPKWRE